MAGADRSTGTFIVVLAEEVVVDPNPFSPATVEEEDDFFFFFGLLFFAQSDVDKHGRVTRRSNAIAAAGAGNVVGSLVERVEIVMGAGAKAYPVFGSSEATRVAVTRLDVARARRDTFIAIDYLLLLLICKRVSLQRVT